MTVNRLIAMGGRGIKSPVERFIETKGQMERGRLRNVQEKAGYQNIGINQKKMQMAEQEQQIQMFGGLAKGVLQSDNPALAYQQAVDQLQSYGIPTDKIPPAYSEEYRPGLEQMVEMAGLELDEQWTQGTGTSGAPVQTSSKSGKQISGITPSKADKNARKDMIYEGQRVPGIVFPSGVVVNADTGEAMPGATFAPTREEAGGVGAFTKGASTQLDKDVMTQLQMRDSINVLSGKYKEFKASGYSKNKLTSWASGIGNMAESLGVPLPEGWAAANASYDDLMVASGRVFDAYRKKVTGSQAAVAELDRYLTKRVPDEGDAQTRYEAKLQAIIEFDEIATIRLSRLKKDGWTYAGTMGEGDNQEAVVSKDGQTVPISQAMSLDQIPMYSDRRNQIMTELSGGRLREDISPAERKQMAAKTLRRLKAEGYNVDAR